MSWRRASPGDLVAGATVAATSLPQYIAYAELAGLAGHHGLRCSGPPLLAFSLVTGSPLLSIGVTSITALMAHATLGGAEYRENNGDEAWMDLLGAFAVLVGVASVALAAAGAAGLVPLIPGPVKTGWKLGFAITVVASQAAGAVFCSGAKFVKGRCSPPTVSIPGVLPGTTISGGAAAIFRLAWILAHPHLWDAATAALAALALVVVLKGRSLLGRLLRAATRQRILAPVAGLEVIVATVLGTLLAVNFGYSGGVVGVVPTGTPVQSPEGIGPAALLASWVRKWPWDLPWSELADRLGGWPWAFASAAAFAAVDFLAIVSVVESGPLTRELAGQGLGCIVSGLAGSAPVGGSLSRSLVAKMTGASSPLAGLVNGLVTMALATPRVAALLAPTPKAVLAAVVLAAVLPSVICPTDVLRLRGREAAIAWTTALASALSDPATGFGAGLALYALLHVTGRRKVE